MENQKHNFGDIQPSRCGLSPASDQGLSTSSPPKARMEQLHPSVRADSLFGWQAERMRRLARICRCLDRGQGEGKRLSRMLRLHAWRWHGRRYRSEPTRLIRFSAGTIKLAFYNWKHGGSKPEALALHYRCGKEKLGHDQVARFTGLCLNPDVCSFSQGYRRLFEPAGTESAYRYALGAGGRKLLNGLFAVRRKAARLESQAEKAFRFMEGIGA